MDSSLSIDLSQAEKAIAEMLPVTQSDLIPLLQKLQDIYGYLPRQVLKRVAEETDIPMSSMVGVATFYEQFSLKPQGRHIIRVCRGTACHVRGGARIAAAVGRQLGICEGETTKDMQFSFHTVACLGTCFLGPVMMIDRNYYGRLMPERVGAILDRYRLAEPAGKGIHDQAKFSLRT